MKKKDIFFGLMIAVFLALVISPFASSWPDGLEKVAAQKGFLEKAKEMPISSAIAPDYAWPGIKNERLATSVAGVAGTIVVFLFAYGIAVVLKRKTNT